MAAGDPLTSTYLTTGAGSAVGQREDLTDVISRIDPAETPGFSNYRKGTQTAIFHEWQEQLLDAITTEVPGNHVYVSYLALDGFVYRGCPVQVVGRAVVYV